MTKEDDLHYLKGLRDEYKPRGRTLLVGSKLYNGSFDRRNWYKNVLGLDLLPGEGVDVVHDLHEFPKDIGRFGHVDCCSVLEHCERPWMVAKNIGKLLNPKGTILLSVPFAWRVHGYPSDYWRMTTEAVKVIFPQIAWKRLEYTSMGKHVDRPRGERFAVNRTEVVGFGIKLA